MDIERLVVDAATLYLLWQGNRIFAQQGPAVPPINWQSRLRSAGRYWPLAVMAVLAVAIWIQPYFAPAPMSAPTKTESISQVSLSFPEDIQPHGPTFATILLTGDFAPRCPPIFPNRWNIWECFPIRETKDSVRVILIYDHPISYETLKLYADGVELPGSRWVIVSSDKIYTDIRVSDIATTKVLRIEPVRNL